MKRNVKSNMSHAIKLLSNSKNKKQSKAAIKKLALEGGYFPQKQINHFAIALRSILHLVSFALLNLQGFILVFIAILLGYTYFVGLNEGKTALILSTQLIGWALICKVSRNIFDEITPKLY